jgi:hypothetical protein
MPNVLLMDSFDPYASSSSFATGMRARDWIANSAVNLGGTTGGRFGGLAFAPHPSNGWRHFWSAAASEFTFGAALNGQSFSSSVHLHFGMDGTRHVGLIFNADGSISITRDATVLATSDIAVINNGVWVSLEVEVVIDDSAGRVSVYVEGDKVVEVTGADTRNGTPTQCNCVQLGGSSWTGAGSSGNHYWDDLYVIDSATKPSNAQRIETLVPVSDGGTLQWTPGTGTTHYNLVDELPVTTTANDNLQSSTVGHVDELNLADLSNVPAEILAVQAYAFGSKDDAGHRAIKVGVKAGATVAEPANDTYLTVAGGCSNLLMSANPDTAGAWNAAAVNSLIIRPRLTV